MEITAKQIKKFKKQLKNAKKAGDPNWQLVEHLLQLVIMQAQQNLDLQAQLEVLDENNESNIANIVESLQCFDKTNVYKNNLSEDEVNLAINHLNSAITAYENGQNVAKYASSILKFAAVLI
jgi:hypothetical protein